MEFKVTTDLAVFKQPILFNADELKAELTQRLEHYNTLVVTEDAIRDAKADRATRNQLRTAMENKRKEIKAQCETPYAAFKVQYDEVLSKADGCADENQYKCAAMRIFTYCIGLWRGLPVSRYGKEKFIETNKNRQTLV